MPLVPALRRASVAAILLLGTSAVQASVAFHVTVTTERDNKPGVKTSLPARETQDSDVVLGEHFGVRITRLVPAGPNTKRSKN